jgi:hypothetical protein
MVSQKRVTPHGIVLYQLCPKRVDGTANKNGSLSKISGDLMGGKCVGGSISTKS